MRSRRQRGANCQNVVYQQNALAVRDHYTRTNQNAPATLSHLFARERLVCDRVGRVRTSPILNDRWLALQYASRTESKALALVIAAFQLTPSRKR